MDKKYIVLFFDVIVSVKYFPITACPPSLDEKNSNKLDLICRCHLFGIFRINLEDGTATSCLKMNQTEQIFHSKYRTNRCFVLAGRNSYQRGVQCAEEAIESLGRTVRLLIRVTQPLQGGDTVDDNDVFSIIKGFCTPSINFFFCLHFKEWLQVQYSRIRKSMYEIGRSELGYVGVFPEKMLSWICKNK